jgi:Tfp pilus assembly protein PilX
MNKGMALITVLIFTFLLFALVGFFLSLVTNARLINERYHENLIALGLAEAGVDYAIWEINFGGGDFSVAEGWSGTNPKTTTINNFQDTDSNIYGDINISCIIMGHPRLL